MSKSAVCNRKKRHGTFDEAQEAAVKLRGLGATFVVPYHCSVCLGFHVGNPPGGIKTLKKKRAKRYRERSYRIKRGEW